MVILVISGYESNTAASQGPLISLDSNSIAFYNWLVQIQKPQKKSVLVQMTRKDQTDGGCSALKKRDVDSGTTSIVLVDNQTETKKVYLIPYLCAFCSILIKYI